MSLSGCCALPWCATSMQRRSWLWGAFRSALALLERWRRPSSRRWCKTLRRMRGQSEFRGLLVARSELKGVLCLCRLGTGNVFSENEFGLATRFGYLAALAIDNADIRARLRTQVVTDHLTGLRNHRFFHERLAEEVARAMRLHSNMALLLF